MSCRDGRSLHSHSCSRGDRGCKKPESCLENIFCSIPSMRLSLHECILDLQCHYLLLFTSPSEQSSVVAALWVPNITSMNAISLYSLLIISVLLCYSVFRKPVCRAAPPAEAGNAGQKAATFILKWTSTVFQPPLHHSPFGFTSTPLKSSSNEVLCRTVLTGLNSEVPKPILLILQRLIMMSLKGNIAYERKVC